MFMGEKIERILILKTINKLTPLAWKYYSNDGGTHPEEAQKEKIKAYVYFIIFEFDHCMGYLITHC